MNNIRYSKTCPNCSTVVYYKTIGSYYANHHKNTQCRTCKGKEHSKMLKGRPRPIFTDEWRKNIAIGHKNSEAWKMSMNTPEYKEKHRQKMLKMIREGKSKVAFNPKACDLFNYLNQFLGWDGLHAKNGKEQSVDVFFIDYYEPSLNVAIEWDEKHHRKPSRYKGDWIKQKIVMEKTGCEFYRIDEVNKQVRKIDKLSDDRTQEIQKVIGEYYENKK